jgi:hypothetical protein
LEDVDVLFRVESGRITVRPLERLAPGDVAIGDSAGRAANAAAVGGAARSALLGIEPR